MTSRRDFLKRTGSAAAIAAVGGTVLPGLASAMTSMPVYPHGVSAFEELPIKELLMSAIGAAKSAGASFSDARIGRYRQNFVGTREKQITQVGDTDSIGIGVRALVNGAWGFAASQNLTTDGVVAAAREAAAIAKANAIPGAAPVVLAPSPSYPNATWKSAYQIDPFTIPVEQKAQLLIDANTEAMKVANVKFVNSTLFFIREDRNYANTDGSFIQQTLIRSWAPFTATAVAPDFSDFQSRGNVVQPMGRGWEFITQADLVGNARKWGEEAAEKLKAKPVEVGRYDLVLHPSHLWLTIHESIGHATELDRALGYEANYAGTSFATPDKL
ncbi:MAG TPA: DNA gyrase modulator, partial [Casimicrobiaceae bacterium]